MTHRHRAGAVLLAAGALLLTPAAGPAQTTMTGTQQATLFQFAMTHMDAETQKLARLRNHIPSREVVPVPVAGLSLGPAQRRALGRAPGMRRAALLAALDKATVADVDRNNGQSPDQSSLAEYLQHLNVAPSSVVAVDVDTKSDPLNPHVTVFYRK